MFPRPKYGPPHLDGREGWPAGLLRRHLYGRQEVLHVPGGCGGRRGGMKLLERTTGSTHCRQVPYHCVVELQVRQGDGARANFGCHSNRTQPYLVRAPRLGVQQYASDVLRRPAQVRHTSTEHTPHHPSLTCRTAPPTRSRTCGPPRRTHEPRSARSRPPHPARSRALQPRPPQPQPQRVPTPWLRPNLPALAQDAAAAAAAVSAAVGLLPPPPAAAPLPPCLPWRWLRAPRRPPPRSPGWSPRPQSGRGEQGEQRQLNQVFGCPLTGHWGEPRGRSRMRPAPAACGRCEQTGGTAAQAQGASKFVQRDQGRPTSGDFIWNEAIACRLGMARKASEQALGHMPTEATRRVELRGAGCRRMPLRDRTFRAAMRQSPPAQPQPPTHAPAASALCGAPPVRPPPRRSVRRTWP